MAAIPSLAKCWAAVPPAFDSLMVPVNGLFPPALSRPEHGAAVPLSSPGARISLFLGPKGSHRPGTSPATIVEVCLRERVEELERLLRARQEHCRRVHGCEQEV